MPMFFCQKQIAAARHQGVKRIRDRIAQPQTQRRALRKRTVLCQNCQRGHHNERTCTAPCANCLSPDHTQRNCALSCGNCGSTGHQILDCTEQVRPRGGPSCAVCGHQGHDWTFCLKISQVVPAADLDATNQSNSERPCAVCDGHDHHTLNCPLPNQREVPQHGPQILQIPAARQTVDNRVPYEAFRASVLKTGYLSDYFPMNVQEDPAPKDPFLELWDENEELRVEGEVVNFNQNGSIIIF